MAGTLWTTIKGKRVKIEILPSGKKYYFDEHNRRLTSKGTLYKRGMSYKKRRE